MYAISNTPRVYVLALFLLCSSLLFAPSLASASDYWSVLEKRFIPASEVPKAVQDMLGSGVKRPVGTTITTTSTAPTITKNAGGGLSVSTQNVLRQMNYPAPFESTLDHSLSSAKAALKSCMRSPACAARALGSAAIIAEGIKAWGDVIDIILDENGEVVREYPLILPPVNPSGAMCMLNTGEVFSSCAEGLAFFNATQCKGGEWYCPVSTSAFSSGFNIVGKTGSIVGALTYIYGSCPQGATYTFDGCASPTEKKQVPFPPEELDESIDEHYDPAPSDGPFVLLSGSPDGITLTTPSPITFPPETTTRTDGQGNTTTIIKEKVIEYGVKDNSTPSPIIDGTTTTTETIYDNNGNVTDTNTTVIVEDGVQHDTPPRVTSPVPVEFELPSFCSWASIVCDWVGWTKEAIDEPDPDLANLISEFEPDENQYSSSIGAGSCPAPMSLELGIISRTVEVSYQPFCDFLDMIRPLVIAGAWLLSAFMYVGVLRRG